MKHGRISQSMKNWQFSTFFFSFILPSFFLILILLLFLNRLPFKLCLLLILFLYAAASSVSFLLFRHNTKKMTDSMTSILDLHMENEYKLQIAQKAAEYQALQAEVNPHFLYNILNLFITLNRIGAKKELEKSIISLSHLFRYTCEHTSDSTLEKEFAFIADYLRLQKIRFEDRLTFQIYMESGVENFLIPKLLIQPLVENAIVHGLEPSTQTVDIQLSALTADSPGGYRFTIISVVNNGVPFPEHDPGAGRVGLENIQERLGIFNSNAFLTISGGNEKPTKCHVIIPMENTENIES